MAQIQRGETFVDGQIVNAARLNNLVDLATALSGIILDQTATSVSVNDQVLIWDDATNSLKRTTLAVLFTDVVGVTSVGLTMPAATFNVANTPITGANTFVVTWDQQPANQVLCGPSSGGAGTPDFRALKVADTNIPTVDIAALTINWDLGNVFTKSLTGNAALNFANPNEGQTIRVWLKNDASRTVTWPTVRWPGGVAHTMTAGANKIDICTFTYINAVVYGTFEKDFSA